MWRYKEKSGTQSKDLTSLCWHPASRLSASITEVSSLAALWYSSPNGQGQLLKRKENYESFLFYFQYKQENEINSYYLYKQPF